MQSLLDKSQAITAFMEAFNPKHSCQVCQKLREMKKIKDPKLKLVKLKEAVRMAAKPDSNCSFSMLIKTHAQKIFNAIQTGKLET